MARALALLCGVAAQSLEVLECSGPWTSLRSRLYNLATPSLCHARHFAVSSQEALSVVADFQETSAADAEDCPLGGVAVHLVEAIGVDREAMQMFLEKDWQILQAFDWRTLLLSGWPIFQLLLLLHKHLVGVADCCDACLGTENYAKRLKMALRHQPYTGAGLTAQSLSFLMGESAASCPLLASAAILAIAWARLPVYDIETEGLIAQAEQRTTLMDLVLVDVGPPLPLLAARLSAASQLSMHLPDPPAAEVSGFACTQRCRVLCCAWHDSVHARNAPIIFMQSERERDIQI
eukprot:Skav207274  [mRNA]  locus=scaffold434:77424:78299:- [translate_table: standard]